MTQTLTEQVLTIVSCVAATMLTRFIPFLLFPPGRPTPAYIQYLGRHLPLAVFALLVVYCLRQVDPLTAPYGAPELLGIAITSALHLWLRQMLISIAGGTIAYMLLVQWVFS